jgi:hypothetical protein
MKANFYEVVYPDKGYRLLNIGEALREGDEVSMAIGRRYNKTNRTWLKVGDSLRGLTINEPGEYPVARPYGYYRRKITK